MADETIKIKVETDGIDNIENQLEGASEASKNLKQQLREATLELQRLSTTEGVDPKKIEEAAIKVGELKDAIADANEQANLFAAGSKYERVSNAFGEISGAIANLDFEKAQARAQSFATIASSITFGDAIQSAKQLGQTFLTIGKALLSNPLFLLAAVIVAIVAAIVKLLDKIGLLKVITEAIGKVFDALMVPINALIDGLKELTDWFGWTSNAAEESAQRQADAAKMAADAQKKSSEETIQGLDNQIRMRELEGKSTVDLERQKVQELRKTAAEQAKADRLAYQAAVTKGELSKEELANLKEVARQSRLAYQQATDDVKFFEATVRKEIKDTEEANTQKQKEEEAKRKADRAAAYKERLQKQKEFNAQREQIERQIEDINLSLLEAGVQKELEINRVKYERLIEDTLSNEKLLQEEKDKLVALYNTQRQISDDQIREADRVKKENEATAEGQKELEMLRQQQDLKVQYMAEGQAKEQAQVELGYQEELLKLQQALDNEVITREMYDQMVVTATRNREAAIDDINQEYADKEIERQKVLQDQKINGVKNALSTISSLAELFNNGSQKSAERAFKIQKGVQIATATIDTFKAATSAYSSLSGIPVVGPVLGALAAAAAVAAGLANIKKIAATKFQPDGGGSVPSATTPSTPNLNATPPGAPTPPSISLFGQPNEGGSIQGEQQSGLRQQSVVKAVVVESDITNTQNRLSTYQQRAEIG